MSVREQSLKKIENKVSPSSSSSLLFPQKIGEFLIARGLIRLDQLETALREQSRSHQRLGETLISLKFLSPQDFYPLLADYLGFSYVALETQIIPPSLLSQGTPFFLPFAQNEGIICVAMGDPHHIFQRYEIQKRFPNHQIFVADPVLIKKISHDHPVISTDSISFNFTSQQVSDESVVALAQQIFNGGISRRASDIHFLPQEKITKVYYRIDGILQEVQTFHKPLWASLKSHLKVLAHLDLAESRRPQDGRITFQYSTQSVDCRLSFVPTHLGESLVVRLLDQTRLQLDIDYLGFLDQQKEQLRRIACQAQGLFLISGPTGSGKTSTLYALLKEIIGQQKNIMTVEEPIEYRMEGIRQAEVQQGVNTFSDLLRSLLRHDPDVIYISEIRDYETAQTAIRAALTGHLVFSTIHANSSCLIPQRLRDLGISLSDLSGTLLALMSQRLIRKLCSSCGGEGCDECHESGYKGRQVISEILPCDDQFRQICLENLNWQLLEGWRKSLDCWQMEDVKTYYITHKITNEQELNRAFGVSLTKEKSSRGRLHVI